MAEEDEGSSTDPTTTQQHVLLISAGASHSVALLSGNVVCSWGRGEDGQLGHGDAEDRLIPTQMSAFNGQDIVSVTCGADHTTAYSDSSSQVYSWGWGDFGRLGHGNSTDVFTPQPVKALQGVRIRQIACGDSHCLAVTMDGQVQSWGRNQNGQLGLGTTEDSALPQKIQAFQGIAVKMIAAGAEHTAAITEDGVLYGWGWGRYGNLGLGDRNDRLVPEKVSAVEEKMVIVACGWRHTISVSSAGALYTYGWSKYGQLGHGDFEDHLVPHQLESLRDAYVSQISGGWRHTMAVTSDGKLYGWGWNKIAHQPSIYVLDSPGVLVPSIPDKKTGLKLALTGSVKDSVVGEERLAQYLLDILNSRSTPLHWKNLNNRRMEHYKTRDKEDRLKDILPKGRKQLHSSDVCYIEDLVAEVQCALYVTLTEFDGDIEDENDLESLIEKQFKVLQKAFKINPNKAQEEARAMISKKFLTLFRTGKLGKFTLDDVPDAIRPVQ